METGSAPTPTRRIAPTIPSGHVDVVSCAPLGLLRRKSGHETCLRAEATLGVQNLHDLV
jgi:hypothetical protein